MILQYSNGITECYEEAQSISVGEIDIDKNFNLGDVICSIGEKNKARMGRTVV